MYRKIHSLVVRTRLFRAWHKKTAIFAVIILFLIALTGILLGWKKQLQLLPDTHSVSNQNLSWLPVDSIQNSAVIYAVKSGLVKPPAIIDRIDIRPEKGIAKITFKKSFVEIQINGYSGKVMSSGERYSDIIEKIHDGSILDFYNNDSNQPFKLVYTTTAGLGLLILCITGLSLWWNPKVIRKLKKEDHE